MPKLYVKKRRETISKIYRFYFTSFHNAIISISKHYLCPIVRGKKIKKVEFGVKLNKPQID